MRPIPPYPKKPHKASGCARVRIAGRDYWLGQWGTDESKRRYAQLASEWVATGPPIPSGQSLTVGEICGRYLHHAAQTKSPHESYVYGRIIKSLSRWHDRPASEFDDRALRSWRDTLIDGSWDPDADSWSMRYINRAVTKAKAIWCWAETERLVPRGSYAALQLVKPLRSTDRRVRCTKPREGATWEQVEAVLPHLPPVVAAIVEIQWWSGMRPCEVVRMRACDVEPNGDDIMLYALRDGKNAWRGRDVEAVILGPEACRVLAPWLAAAKRRGPEAVLFPARGGKPYTTGGYYQAVQGAFELNPSLVRWTPYQLRHGAKRRITRSHGLDAARAVLRQTSISTTDRYDALRDTQLAISVAKKTG